MVAMNAEKQVAMLDMGLYLKKFTPAESLEDRVWKDYGEDSETFLRQIMLKQPAPNLLSRRGNQEMEAYLKSNGPALMNFVQTQQTSMGFYPANSHNHV